MSTSIFLDSEGARVRTFCGAPLPFPNLGWKLIAIAVILSVAGCEKGTVPTSADVSAPHLVRFEEGANIRVNVRTRATFFDRSGRPIAKHDFGRRSAIGKISNGIAIGRVSRAIDAPTARSGALLNSAPQAPAFSYDAAGDPTVIGILDGQLQESYTEALNDSAGVAWTTVSTAPDGEPVTRTVVRRAGALSSVVIYGWKRTSGGWYLATQNAFIYDEQGYHVAEVVDSTSLEFGTASSTFDHAIRATASLAWNALCSLGPKTAWAQTSNWSNKCFTKGLYFAAASAALVSGTVAYAAAVNPATAAVAPPVTAGVVAAYTTGYLGLWGGWTASLIELGQCLNEKEKEKRSQQPEVL